jgi:Flp pilus assembly secretin CpaC
MRAWLVGLAGCLLVGMLGVPGPSASAQSLTRLYLSASKAMVIDLKGPARKVAVANPAIADIQVISPTQLLVIGRGIGVTSLVVFFPRSVLQYDVVVHGAPIGAIGAETLTGAPHVVLVQRGDKLTEQFFSRDTSERWVEVGTVKVEATAAPK